MNLFMFDLPLLQAAPGSGLDPLLQMLPFVAIFVVFYFLLMRPQRKQQKELQKLRDNLGKGDKVISDGGIYGTILSVKDNKAVVKVDDNTKLLISKKTLTPIVEKGEDSTESKKKLKDVSEAEDAAEER